MTSPAPPSSPVTAATPVSASAVTADDATAIATSSSTAVAASAAASPAKKKKTKKANYKNMLAGMMEGSGPRDAQKDKEIIKKVTGGGAFVKVDKI